MDSSETKPKQKQHQKRIKLPRDISVRRNLIFVNKKKKLEKGNIREYLKEHYETEEEKLENRWRSDCWDGDNDWLNEK